MHRSAQILYGKLEVVRYRTCRVAARFLKGRVVRAVWVELERPDRRDRPVEERLLLCTDPDLPAPEVPEAATTVMSSGSSTPPTRPGARASDTAVG